MLFVIQFPISDSRAFVDEDTGKLNVPFWPFPNPDSDFIKRFGAIRQRWRGGLSGWIGENYICRASRAIRFPNMLSFSKPNDGIDYSFDVAFRRFFFDGKAVGKLEVGISARSKHDTLLSREESKELFYHILNLPVLIPVPNSTYIKCPLFQSGKHLAHLYASSSSKTTRRKKRMNQSWWVQSLNPIILVELRRNKDKNINIPFWGMPVSLPSNIHLDLSHHIIPFGGQNLRMWAMREEQLDEEIYGNDNGILESRGDINRRKLREIRICLLRLHAERVVLRQILSNIASRKLSIIPRSEYSDELQQYLNLATRHISRLERQSDNHFEADLVDIVREAEDAILPGERDQILYELKRINIRRNVYNKVENYVNQIVVNGPFIQEQQLQFIQGNTLIHTEENYMSKGDNYNVNQAGSVGPNSQASDMNFFQIGSIPGKDFDIKTLASELDMLRQKLKEEAQEPEHDTDIGNIAAAEIEAKKGNKEKALEYLSKAGKWTFDVATRIGVGLVVELLKPTLGLK